MSNWTNFLGSIKAQQWFLKHSQIMLESMSIRFFSYHLKCCCPLKSKNWTYATRILRRNSCKFFSYLVFIKMGLQVSGCWAPWNLETYVPEWNTEHLINCNEFFSWLFLVVPPRIGPFVRVLQGGAHLL